MKKSQFTFTGIVKPRQFEWHPKDDITTYELALCFPIFCVGMHRCIGEQYDKLPDNAKRHFIEL